MARHKPNVELLIVVWEDATYHDGYEHEERPNTTELAVSAGKAVCVDDKQVTIGFTQFADRDSKHMLTVPRGMVRRTHRVKLYVPGFTRDEPAGAAAMKKRKA